MTLLIIYLLAIIAMARFVKGSPYEWLGMKRPEPGVVVNAIGWVIAAPILLGRRAWRRVRPPRLPV